MNDDAKKLLEGETLTALAYIERTATRFAVAPEDLVRAGLVQAGRGRTPHAADVHAAAQHVSSLFPELFRTIDPVPFAPPAPAEEVAAEPAPPVEPAAAASAKKATAKKTGKAPG